jgi:hypothetical protein
MALLKTKASPQPRRYQQPAPGGDGKDSRKVGKNLTEMAWDESDAQVTEEDLNWDYVNMLVNTLPKLRNKYARQHEPSRSGFVDNPDCLRDHQSAL